MTPKNEQSLVYDGDDGHGLWIATAVFLCDNCSRLVLASCIAVDLQRSTDAHDLIKASYPAEVMWLPAAGTPQEFDDVPAHIASAASEAHECSSIGAYRAAIVS